MKNLDLTTELPPSRLKLAPQVFQRKFLDALAIATPNYPFDHYRLYPSTRPVAWREYRLARLRDSLHDEESVFFGDLDGECPLLLGCKTSQWDLEHFGFKMSKVHWMVGGGHPRHAEKLERLLDQCLAFLVAQKVRFVSARLDSDDLQCIHALERAGFRYYETMLWPVVPTANLPFAQPSNVRFFRDSDLDRFIEIAEHHQYTRGHFYTDPCFDRKTVDAMYVKWIRTSHRNKEPITVIEVDGRVVGGFVFRNDPLLAAHMGYRYGRMHLLTLDSSVRGKGLGLALFQGSMRLMAEAGCQWIDSGYAGKNHLSARLHSKSGFYSVYEELTFHRWL